MPIALVETEIRGSSNNPQRVGIVDAMVVVHHPFVGRYQKDFLLIVATFAVLYSMLQRTQHVSHCELFLFV